MTSLARRTREKKLAQKLAKDQNIQIHPGKAAPMPASGTGVPEYNALLAAMHNDLREISDIASLEARNPVKRKKATTYTDWVEGVLIAGDGEDGKAVQDEIIVNILIWAIDYGDYEYALRIGAHCLKHGLTAPAGYSRSIGCILAEEIAENALRSNGDVSLQILTTTDIMTENSDMPDQVRAKLKKAIGRGYAAMADAYVDGADNAVAGGKPALVMAALDNMQRALQLNKKAGVKNDIGTLAATLKKMGGPPKDMVTETDVK